MTTAERVVAHEISRYTPAELYAWPVPEPTFNVADSVYALRRYLLGRLVADDEDAGPALDELDYIESALR